MSILQNIMPKRRDEMANDGTLPRTVPVPRPNGDRAAALKEKHYADYAQALEDRDRAMQERDAAIERVRQSEEICTKATHRITGMVDEINHLKQRLDDQAADFKSRVMTYQIERDQAVAIASELRGTIADIKSIVNRHETPARPVVALDAEAPSTISATVQYPAAQTSIGPPIAKPPTHAEMLRLVEKMEAKP